MTLLPSVDAVLSGHESKVGGLRREATGEEERGVEEEEVVLVVLVVVEE